MLLSLPCDGVIELYTLVELNLRASRFCFAVAQWSTFIYFETQLSSHLTASNFLLSFFHFQQELIVWYLLWNSLEQLWATLHWTNWTNNKVVCCTILFVLVCFFFLRKKATTSQLYWNTVHFSLPFIYHIFQDSTKTGVKVCQQQRCSVFRNNQNHHNIWKLFSGVFHLSYLRTNKLGEVLDSWSETTLKA